MARASDPHAARQAAGAVVDRLRKAGHVAYFAGGCVRDALLGLRPTDYDVATDATPPRVRSLFSRTQEVGAAFGVVLVNMHPEDWSAPSRTAQRVTVEVATFRADGPYTDARRPDSVVFSDPRSDAERRDFTVNALFIDPPGHAALAPDQTVRDADGVILGTVIDYVGGLADLRARTLRAVGDPDKRLAEDHLRALRAVRFAARLGFTIDPATRAAITRHAAQLRGVSRERIGDELRRVLAHPSRAVAIDLLQDLGLDGPVLDSPHLEVRPTLLAGLPASLGAAPAELGLSLAAWLLDRHRSQTGEIWFNPASVAEIVRRLSRALCLSNDESDALRTILSTCNDIATTWNTRETASRKRLAGKNLFEKSLSLVTATDPATALAVSKEVSRLASDGIGLGPEPFLTGDDLVAAGHTPGPRFKVVLDEVYNAQLDGRVRDKAGAMELARTLGV